MIRRLLRVFRILSVVLRYGLDNIAMSGVTPRIALLTKRLLFWRDISAPRGERLRRALEELGPIFVKFGQLLSTRRDLLPPDMADELTLLQDRVPPFDPAIAMATIERAFRRPIDTLFASFEREPVASASIAQVHFGTLRMRDGRLQDVAVKVLRPGMLRVIEQDLALMRMQADAHRQQQVLDMQGRLHDMGWQP